MTEPNPKFKTIGILQPGYLPWLGFFEQMHRSDVFVIYDDVQYDKHGWRNRNRIKTTQGMLWLTVPVLSKGRAFPLIKEVEINTAVRWGKKHINSIIQSYAKAPFFDQYIDGLLSILESPYKYLIDLDLHLIAWLADQLGISTPVKLSSELEVPGKNVQRLIDIIQSLGGNHFYEGAAGRNYINVADFEARGIAVTFQNYRHPVYSQLHGDFVSHLSSIDLLFNCGQDSRKILTGQ